MSPKIPFIICLHRNMKSIIQSFTTQSFLRNFSKYKPHYNIRTFGSPYIFKRSYAMPYLEDGGPVAYSSMKGVIDDRLLTALNTMGYETMSDVQQAVLTKLPSFTTDCLVQAKTGTGKTTAFLLPALHTILHSDKPYGQVSVLIISPTRELALQIAKECDQLTSQLGRNRLECHTAFGGSARASALSKFLNGNPAILVATPGRLKDYLSEEEVRHRFQNIRTVILDEADTMLESGFLADVKAILRTLPPKSTGWQGMCFSATVPAKTREVVDVVLAKGYTSISTIDKNEPPTIEKVPQFSVVMPQVTDTFNTLVSLLNKEVTPDSKVIVFGVTANMVALFAQMLSKGLTNLPISELHSRLSQNARTRTTNQFKTAESGIMVASDVIGRGMDFPSVDLVIQVGLPSSADQYIHRVGRTGRAGNTGRAVIMLTERESFFLKANRHLPINEHPDSAAILKESNVYAEHVERAMHTVEGNVKQKAYSSYIGFFAGSGLLKQMRLDKADLVRMSNDLAVQGMHCPEPPAMEKKTVGKMGLKGVPGFNYAVAGDGERIQQFSRQQPRQNNNRPKQEGVDRDVLRPNTAGGGSIKKKPFQNKNRNNRASGGDRNRAT